MKKRILILIAVLLTLCSCGKAGDHDQDQITLTVPAVLFRDMTAREIRSEARKRGHLSHTIEEDGSVTYTMTKHKQQQALNDYRKQVNHVIDTLTTGKSKVKSFEEITYKEDLSRIDIQVHMELYTEEDHFHADRFFRAAVMYQMLSEVPPSEIDVVVTFRDPITRLVLDRVTFRESLSADELAFFENDAPESTTETSPALQ